MVLEKARTIFQSREDDFRDIDLQDDTTPKIGEILTKFSEGQERQRTFTAECEKARKYYLSKNEVPVPKAADTEEMGEPVHTGTSHAIINIATDHVDINNLAIDVPGSGRARARSEKIHTFLQGTWMNVKAPVKRMVARHCFEFGCAVTKTMFNPDLWPDAPHFDGKEGDPEEAIYKEELADYLDARRINFPIEVFSVSPMNFIWDDARRGMKWGIEFYISPAHDVKSMFPDWNRPEGVGSGDLVTWMEYWDETWFGIVASTGTEGKNGSWLMEPIRHGYGFQPYTLYHPTNSDDVSTGPIDERFTSILRPNYELLDSIDRQFTAMEAMGIAYAFPGIDIHAPNKTTADAIIENYEPSGKVNALYGGAEAKPSPRPPVPQDAFQILQSVESKVEQGSFPNVVAGQRPTGLSTGFAVSVLAGMGRLVFQGVADAIGEGFADVGVKMLMLVENKVRGPITVHARTNVQNFDTTIKPSDIRGKYEHKITLKAEAPEEAERQANLALALWNQGDGIISQLTAMQRARISDPLTEMVQIRAEKILLLLNEMQLPQAAEELAQGSQQPAALGAAQQFAGELDQTSGGGFNSGQFGPVQGPRVGEAGIQDRRIRTRQNNERTFPRGVGEGDVLGRILGGSSGNGISQPSGGRAGGA